MSQVTAPVKEQQLNTVGGSQLVRFADGYLTARVKDVSLDEMLDEIARQSGLIVKRNGALNQRVSLEFHRLSLEHALRRILRHRSFVFEYAAARPTTLWILPEGEEEYDDQGGDVKRTDVEGFGKETAIEMSRLQVTLSSGDPEARLEAAEQLGEGRHAEAVAPLTLALADSDQDVREAAIIALADIGGAEAVQALGVALSDEDPRIREEAVDALGEIGGDIAVGVVEQALADEETFVRQAATEVLYELRNTAP